MTPRNRPNRRSLTLLFPLLLSLTLVFPSLVRAEDDNNNGRVFTQTNLVSDLSGTAHMQDTNLVNPWGLAASPTSPWWVADNGKGVSTVYNANGTPQRAPVTIPPPNGSPPGTTATPTGTVFNSTGDFAVTRGNATHASVFLFATEDGTLSGWAPMVDANNAIIAVDNSGAGAVYKGLALARNRSGNFLFATNFHAGTVDVFDAHFMPAHLAGAFTDPTLPAGFAPFGIRAFGDRLYVTYALQKQPDKHDDQADPGNGFVDIYDTEGHLQRHLIAHGALNSPWGLAMAPEAFGHFGKALLVGNFGDGQIHAYNAENGRLLGQLMGSDGKPIMIDGVWALSFGNGGQAGPRDTLFFTAGIDDEQHGLFGTLVARQGDREDEQ
jgi:uncharacterized protein (TIGR03118 family)